MKCSTLDFEFRIIEQAEVYADDEPEILQHLTKTSAEWLRLIDGELEITVDGDVFYSEDPFPLAEFAHSLIEWLSIEPARRQNYSFDDSMNFEDQEGVFTFCREGDGWRLNSLWEEVPGGVWLPTEEFDYKLGNFVAEVRAEILAAWGIDLAMIETEAMVA